MMDAIWWFGYVTALFGLSAFGLHRYFVIWLYYRHKHLRPAPPAEFPELPPVTVQVPVFNEMYVVERLIDAVAALEYPADRLQIQILDDSTDETTAIAARRVAHWQARGVRIEHVTRPNRDGFKAGALANGLRTATGEFLALFDADFVPPPDVLGKTIHYFTDPGVGMIQTRWGHLNREYSLLTRVQSLFLDGHLLIEQTARNRSGRFFNFNGTAGIWRRRCIEESGGWHHDTLTEDLDLSYRAQLRGWRFVFLPDFVTPAELPVEMNAFKNQQHRWAKGSIQTCLKLLPAVWRGNLPLPVKIEATFHLTSNFTYLLLFAMCILVNPYFTPDPLGRWLSVLLVDLPIFSMASISVVVFYTCVLRELRPRWWRELWAVPMLIALGIGMSLNNGRAVLEAIFKHDTEFTRTPKYGILSRSQSWTGKRYFALKSLVPFLELALAVYYGYYLFFAITHERWTTLPILVLFFVGFAWVAFMSIFQSAFARSAPAPA